jgi:hypothetical protein
MTITQPYLGTDRQGHLCVPNRVIPQGQKRVLALVRRHNILGLGSSLDKHLAGIQIGSIRRLKEEK